MSPRMSHYACSLCRCWPVNCIFWHIETLDWLFRHYSGQSCNCIKIGGHVALLSGPTVFPMLWLNWSQPGTLRISLPVSDLWLCCGRGFTRMVRVQSKISLKFNNINFAKLYLNLHNLQISFPFCYRFQITWYVHAQPNLGGEGRDCARRLTLIA